MAMPDRQPDIEMRHTVTLEQQILRAEMFSLSVTFAADCLSEAGSPARSVSPGRPLASQASVFLAFVNTSFRISWDKHCRGGSIM